MRWAIHNTSQEQAYENKKTHHSLEAISGSGWGGWGRAGGAHVYNFSVVDFSYTQLLFTSWYPCHRGCHRPPAEGPARLK